MKSTTKIFFSAVFGLACICGSFAATDMKDGFSLKHEQVLITAHGATRVMAGDMQLHSGILVRTDGTIVVRGGDHATLKEGDTMSFGGTITRAASGKVEQLNPVD